MTGSKRASFLAEQYVSEANTGAIVGFLSVGRRIHTVLSDALGNGSENLHEIWRSDVTNVLCNATSWAMLRGRTFQNSL
ncbi:MAG: hypothetical protein ABSF00_10290 [Candidatus Bathyarchaeia archaeon]